MAEGPGNREVGETPPRTLAEKVWDEHVVRSAAMLAQQLAVSWHAVYVETPSLQRLPEPHRRRILATVKQIVAGERTVDEAAKQGFQDYKDGKSGVTPVQANGAAK